MNGSTTVAYREWSRYEWSGPAERTEPDVPRWNLYEWVGDLGDGVRREPIAAADLREGENALSGFRHNPGGGSRWAPPHTGLH